jgi:hypothetical protein
MNDKNTSNICHIQTKITRPDYKALQRLTEAAHSSISTFTRQIIENRLNFERHAGNPVMNEYDYEELFPRTGQPAQPETTPKAADQGITPGNIEIQQAPTENKPSGGI